MSEIRYLGGHNVNKLLFRLKWRKRSIVSLLDDFWRKKPLWCLLWDGATIVQNPREIPCCCESCWFKMLIFFFFFPVDSNDIISVVVINTN